MIRQKVNHELPFSMMAFGALLFFSMAAHAQQAFFMGLGDLPGGDYYSTAADISGDGKIVVGTSRVGPNTSTDYRAYRWTHENGMVLLGRLDIPSTAVAISEDGTTIVGGMANNSTSSPFNAPAYLWREESGMTPLPSAATNVIGLSADGSKVAYVQHTWSEQTGLAASPNGMRIADISSDGLALVGWGGDAPPSTAGFIWTEQGTTVLGPPLDDGTFLNNPAKFSADGNAVVGYGGPGLLWTRNGGLTPLGTLPDGATAAAVDVSADASVIVGGRLPSRDWGAWIWRESQTIELLSDVLTNEYGLGPQLANWSLGTTSAVSADGRTIVGSGTNRNGHNEAWIAYLGTPVPEPSALVLAALAAVALVWSRRPPVTNRTSYSPALAIQNAGLIRIATLLVGVLSVQQCGAAPTYEIAVAGLSDIEHTRDDGYVFNSALHFNESGNIIGSAKRYNGGATELGQSIWIFNGKTTHRIGLTGAEHVRSDGYSFSDFPSGVSGRWNKFQEVSQLAGHSRRFNGDLDWGDSAWFFDGTTTKEIGLLDVEHSRGDGYRSNFVTRINNSGYVLGGSPRYNGGDTQLGWNSWLFDGHDTKAIGLTGAEFTRNDGTQVVSTGSLNDAGQVAGFSDRYDGGNTYLGRTAWLYDGATTIELGLTGSAYIGSGGYKNSSPNSLNSAGHVVGVTERYNGGTQLAGIATWIYDGTSTKNISLPGFEVSLPGYLNEGGQVLGVASRFVGTTGRAWFYDGSRTIRVGLYGVEHTRDDGTQKGVVLDLRESGKSIGMSARYLGDRSQLGQSAWLYNGTTTVNIGLVGPEHTQANGERWSRPEVLNEAGQVIGRSTRYIDNAQAGESAWLYDGSSTIELGLTGSKYTRNDGYESSGVGFLGAGFLNAAGQVLGSTSRFDIPGGNSDAWLYDPVLGYFPLEFSTRSDGRWVTEANYLGDDGLVLGSYRLFDASDNDLGLRAYSFTIEEGMHDLGPLVEDGLSANGWEVLATAIRASNTGQIYGYGKLTSQIDGQMVYVLTPVPEPSSSVLILLGLSMFIGRRPKSLPWRCEPLDLRGSQ